MEKLRRAAEQIGDEPEETLPGVPRTFKLVQLRLLMKEREEMISRLIEIDYNIWVLEEFFRANNAAKDPLTPPGTVVPGGSLSSHGGNPRS